MADVELGPKWGVVFSLEVDVYPILDVKSRDVLLSKELCIVFMAWLVTPYRHADYCF